MTFLQLSELQASSGLKISKNYFSLFQTSDQVGRVGLLLEKITLAARILQKLEKSS